MTEPSSEPSGSARFRSPLVRWGPYVLLAVVLCVALAISASRPDKQNITERTQTVAATIKCPVCADESMATSSAPSSVAGRAEIEKRLAAGQSPAQIRAYFASRFGDSILLTPKSSGIDALIWILPVVAVIIAAAGMAAMFVRWRRLVPNEPTADDRDLVEVARARLADPPDGPSGAPGGPPAS